MDALGVKRMTYQQLSKAQKVKKIVGYAGGCAILAGCMPFMLISHTVEKIADEMFALWLDTWDPDELADLDSD